MPETVAAGLRLAPDALTRPFEPSQFNFKTTAELEPFSACSVRSAPSRRCNSALPCHDPVTTSM